jgi:hypothetical protein
VKSGSNSAAECAGCAKSGYIDWTGPRQSVLSKGNIEMKFYTMVARFATVLALLGILMSTSSCCLTGLFDDDDDNLPGGGGHDEGTGNGF